MQSGECVTHRAPFRYRKLYARLHLAMRPCECPKDEACRLNSAGRPPIRRSLLSRRPLGFGIGPRTSEKLSLSSVSAVSRLADLSRSFRRERIASLPGHLDCTMNFRPPSITVGLRRLSVVTRATLVRPTGLPPARFRIRLSPNGSSCQDFSNSSVPEFLLPGKPGLSSGGTAIINRRFLPGFSGMIPVPLTSAKPALAYATRWVAV